MTHNIKFFLVDSFGRDFYIQLNEYPGNNFIVRFVNDKFSDFVNSFQSTGFGVTVLGNNDPTIQVFGTLKEKDANEIWDQIKNRLAEPDHIVTIDGFNYQED